MINDNIQGVFSLPLGEYNPEIKCTFLVIEKLEKEVFRRPIIHVLADAINQESPVFYTSDIASVIYLGMRANNDTRLSYEQVGEIIVQNGAANYLETYIRFLTYACSGKEKIEITEKVFLQDDKKKVI